MSQQLINRSPDLKRLRDEGYDIEIRANRLLLKAVPYVNTAAEVRRGILVSELTLAGDIATTPSTHVVDFIGEQPCHRDGEPIAKIMNQSNRKDLGDGLIVDHTFSAKPVEGPYKDYYDKMIGYLNILQGPAEAIDPNVTAKTFPLIKGDQDECMFNYLDTASSRAEIMAISKKLELERIAIVGLGGTGSYVLDLVAKTAVKQIHVFDGDTFLQHNAFRSPGAASLEDLERRITKAKYFTEQYGRIHRGIIAHDCFVNESTVQELAEMSFVFLCVDRGAAKRLIIEKLEECGIPFVDVGMGVELANERLLGVLRVTTSTVEKREHVKSRISLSDTNGNNEYSGNIQIADLNALNAALAVIKWKKLFGFYLDLDREHFSAYTIDGNSLVNEDLP